MSLDLEIDANFDEDADVDVDAEVEDEVLDFNYEGMFSEADFLEMGINPSAPTGAKPGSQDKVMMLAARYAAGLPLWHNSDCYDHGPGLLAGDTEELV